MTASDANAAPRRRGRGRWRRALVVLGAFAAGFLVCYALALLRVRQWVNKHTAEQARVMVLMELESLARLRVGRVAEGISTLERTTFSWAVNTLEGKGWDALSDSERRTIVVTKRYGDRVGWPNAEGARTKLAAVPASEIKAGNCSSTLYEFLTSKSSSKQEEGARDPTP